MVFVGLNNLSESRFENRRVIVEKQGFQLIYQVVHAALRLFDLSSSGSGSRGGEVLNLKIGLSFLRLILLQAVQYYLT